MKTFRNIAVVAALASAVALPGLAHAAALTDLLSGSSSASLSANILNFLSVALGLNITT